MYVTYNKEKMTPGGMVVVVIIMIMKYYEDDVINYIRSWWYSRSKKVQAYKIKMYLDGKHYEPGTYAIIGGTAVITEDGVVKLFNTNLAPTITFIRDL